MESYKLSLRHQDSDKSDGFICAKSVIDTIRPRYKPILKVLYAKKFPIRKAAPEAAETTHPTTLDNNNLFSIPPGERLKTCMTGREDEENMETSLHFTYVSCVHPGSAPVELDDDQDGPKLHYGW